MAYDLLIKNARIVDGTGAPAYSGALAVEGGKIAAIGDASGAARREINGDGLILAPGFVDIHRIMTRRSRGIACLRARAGTA